MLELTVDPKEIVKGKTDDRGRLVLGPDHRHSTVTVVVIESEERDDV